MVYTIKPKPKIFKTTVTRLALYFLGHAFQTAYKLDDAVKKEVDSWPPTFSFLFQIEPKGPRMAIVKRNGNLQYLGEKELFNADVTLSVKNIEFGFQAMIGMMSTPRLTYENRQFVKGDLAKLSSIVRCLEVSQLLMLPNFLAKRYIKKVPKLNLKMVRNRFLFYTLGSSGLIK